jgi:hypothetical protein
VPLLAREIQRRIRAEPGRRPHVRAGEDQHLRQLGVAIHRRPVQRGHAVALRRIDVGRLLEQRLDRLAIAARRGVRNR